MLSKVKFFFIAGDDQNRLTEKNCITRFATSKRKMSVPNTKQKSN